MVSKQSELGMALGRPTPHLSGMVTDIGLLMGKDYLGGFTSSFRG
jgi:hypothetical protein